MAKDEQNMSDNWQQVSTNDKYKAMTEQLRLVNTDSDVAGYIRWIIQSDAAQEYYKQKETPVEALNVPKENPTALDVLNWIQYAPGLYLDFDGFYENDVTNSLTSENIIERYKQWFAKKFGEGTEVEYEGKRYMVKRVKTHSCDCTYVDIGLSDPKTYFRENCKEHAKAIVPPYSEIKYLPLDKLKPL